MRPFPIVLALILSLSSPALADCKEPETGTNKVPMFSPPMTEVVIGTGRLAFYSAPKLDCVMPGVFVIPTDVLITNAHSNDGWTSVTYVNPKTGEHISGWVRSSRLKTTGTIGR